MSSGARITTYLIEEETPGVTPATGAWDTVRYTSNTLTPTVTTEESEEITESRLSQGSIVTGMTVGGDVAGELSFGNFDKLLAAAFYGEWNSNVLEIGSVRHTFTVAKCYNDIEVFALLKGMHVSTMDINIPDPGKVTATFTLAGLDYSDSDVSQVTSKNPATTAPAMSNLDVGMITLDGQDMAGVACVASLTINVNNNLQEQRCIGNGRMGPGAQIATGAAVTGVVTLAFSKVAWEIWKNTFTRKPIAFTFPITDPLGNQYIFNFPAIEVSGDLPSGGKNDLVQIALNYTAAKISPTITRVPFVAVTGVTVAPTAPTVAGTATVQLTATVAPAGASSAVTWSSATPGVATVSVTGLAKGVAPGTSVITATSVSDPTKKATVTITVT